MENLNPLFIFFSAIAKDYRISVTHIGIYAALLRYRADKGFANPVEAFKYEIMRLAKISSHVTYHKCIRELSEYGYIRYKASSKRNQRSTIYFVISE